MNCVYMVTSSPPGCEYTTGQIVYLDCEDPCSDIVITDGACKEAYLSAMSCDCA